MLLWVYLIVIVIIYSPCHSKPVVSFFCRTQDDFWRMFHGWRTSMGLFCLYWWTCTCSTCTCSEMTRWKDQNIILNQIKTLICAHIHKLHQIWWHICQLSQAVLTWPHIKFHIVYRQEQLKNYFKYILFVFHRRNKAIHVWNDMNKWGLPLSLDMKSDLICYSFRQECATWGTNHFIFNMMFNS